MKLIATPINHRGQVTIPAELRRFLGLKPDGRVTFVIDAGQVKLVPTRLTLETGYRSVPRLRHSVSDKEMVSIAKAERVKRGTRPLQGAAIKP